MANTKSYTITVDNNISEKEAILYLISSDLNFVTINKENRKKIMDLLKIEKKYSRAFDLLLIPGNTNLEEVIQLENTNDITLVELKTTKKKLINNPYGFFFGATESEFNLAKQLKEKYKFCFVSLHEETRSYKLLTLDELEKIIKTKRIQFQINL